MPSLSSVSNVDLDFELGSFILLPRGFPKWDKRSGDLVNCSQNDNQLDRMRHIYVFDSKCYLFSELRGLQTGKFDIGY